MNNENDGQINMDELEKWMERFFLDPFTSYLDDVMFRIDLYETENDLIIEALLTDYDPAAISIYLKEDQVIIKAKKKEDSPREEPCCHLRKVDFPFLITYKKVNAVFSNGGILEIIISKNEKGSGKNRYIALP